MRTTIYCVVYSTAWNNELAARKNAKITYTTTCDFYFVLLLLDDNEGKLCFVHRDLSSRNVLVSPNVTCVLSDFGFAMKMPEIGSTKSTDDIITEVRFFLKLLLHEQKIYLVGIFEIKTRFFSHLNTIKLVISFFFKKSFSLCLAEFFFVGWNPALHGTRSP